MSLRTFVCLPAVVLLLAFIGGCAHPTSVEPTPADATLTRAAVNLEKPPADRARLLLFNGGKYNDTGYVARAWAVRIKINGVIIGGVNPNEAMILEVRPGPYTIQWEELGGRPLAATIVPATFTLTGGELVPLQMDFDRWDYKVNRKFNPGQLVPGSPERLNPDIEIVRPTSCPTAICL
ncbi:MAG TPA: hypothetical protein VGJ56_25185 [Reyranella sp.]